MLRFHRPPGAMFASRGHTRRTWLILFTIVLSVATYWLGRAFLPDVHGHSPEMAARTLAIFVIVAIFWATETLPLFATAFIAIGLEIIFLATDGGLANELTKLLEVMGFSVDTPEPIKYSVFLEPFAKDIIILFMGGFLLASALSKHHMDVAIARRILKPLCKSPAMLMFGVLGITAFFSMWMSNTATTAMMLAIIAPIVKNFPKEDRFHRGLVLAAAFGANIGGIGTPIGTPPNAIAYGALNAAGYEVSFLQWMMVAVPLELILLVIVGALLYVMFKPKEGLTIAEVKFEHAITARGWITLVILLCTVTLWLTSGWHGIKTGAVALLAAAALTSLKVLDRRDVDSIDWNLLILMWGGLSLSVAMKQSGLADIVAGIDLTHLPGSGVLLAIIVTAIAVAMSTFMSNTATASILVPMALALGVVHNEQYAMLAALACSFAMAMPVSTPPNAMAYATGHVPITTMLRVGAMATFICIAVVLLGYRIMLPLILPEHLEEPEAAQQESNGVGDHAILFPSTAEGGSFLRPIEVTYER